MKPTIFVSHVAEEAKLAQILKVHLSRDFLELVDIFVSSDLESIAAGERWLASLENALRNASTLLVLCSRASLNRPWVNFEVGAAWVREIPIVPVCHSGLRPEQLPIPLILLQGVKASSDRGLKGVYSRVSKTVKCQVPHKDFAVLIDEVKQFEKGYSPRIEEVFAAESQRNTDARTRIYEALADPSREWRSIERLAILGGIGEDETLEMLVKDPNVVFGKGKSKGRRIARLKNRKG